MMHLLSQPELVLKLALAFPFLFILPGYVTQLALFSSSSDRPVRWPEGIFLSVLVSVLLVSPIALLLAELGFFSLITVCLISAVYSASILLLNRRRGRPVWPGWGAPDRWDSLLLLFVLIALPLYGRPHRYVLGGTDAGVYINIGSALAETGGLVLHDSILENTPADSYDSFFSPYDETSAVDYARFTGFFIENGAEGTVIPQFFHLHPVWLGLAAGAGGVWAELLLTPLWAILGCLAVYFATSAVFGRRAGFLALLLLAVNPLQVWFARYPTSEIFTQFLWFSATFASIRFFFQRDHSRLYGLAAGLAWGALLLTRIDAFYTVAVPVLAVLVLVFGRQWRSRHLWFVLPWLLLLVQATCHALFIAHDYFAIVFLPVIKMLGVSPALLVALAGFAVAVLVFLVFFPNARDNIARWVIAHKQLWGTILAIVILLAAIYAYLIRPQVEQGVTYVSGYGGEQIQTSNHENLVRLGWYLSPLGIALSVLGLAWMVGKRLDGRTLLLVGLGIISSFLYIYNILNNPHQVYAMRRYVPSVLPTLVIGIAVLLDRLWLSSRGKQAGRWLAVALLLLLLGHNLWTDRIFARQVDYRGVMDELEQVAQTVPDNTILLINDSAPVGWGDVLGIPLTYIFGKPVVTWRNTLDDPGLLAERLASWQSQGIEVWMIPGEQAMKQEIPGWSLEFVDYRGIRSYVLESSYEYMPQEAVPIGFNVGFYRLVPDSEVQLELPYLVEVGEGDFLVLQAGFYDSELLGDQPYRWTEPEATMVLPGELLSGAGSIRLSLAAYRPEDGTVPVELVLGGESLGTIQVGDEFAVFDLVLPEGGQYDEEETLTFEIPGWNPSGEGVSPDMRELGAMVDWVELVAR